MKIVPHLLKARKIIGSWLWKFEKMIGQEFHKALLILIVIAVILPVFVALVNGWLLGLALLAFAIIIYCTAAEMNENR